MKDKLFWWRFLIWNVIGIVFANFVIKNIF